MVTNIRYYFCCRSVWYSSLCLSHFGIVCCIYLFILFFNNFNFHYRADQGELFEKIFHSGCYSEKDGKQVFRQILDAIAYLHDNNIAHRDLKVINKIILIINKNQ